MQTNITYYAVLLMLTRSIGCVVADYVVQVHLQSYSNPTNRAQSLSGTCCDSPQAEVCNGTHRCDNYFSFCLRPLDTPAQQRICDEPTRIVSAFQANNDAFISFNQPTVLGRANPLNLSVSGPLQDIQLYIEVYDRDYGPNNQDDFIDSFAVNVYYSSAGRSLVNTRGTYGYGIFSLTASTLCAQFFFGDQCQYVDKCHHDSITCSGRGPCIITMNTYICVCDPGYTGTDCEVNINECKDQICNGNGECIDGVNEYRCACKSGYTGAECEINIDECENKNCSGHGQCIDEVNSYHCVCDLGYSGTDCEAEINECDYQNCSGHGQCTDKVNSYSCDCLVGFLGNNCEHIDHCFGVNCSGNGECVVGDSGFNCVCTTGFTGIWCSETASNHGESLALLIGGILGGLVGVLTIVLLMVSLALCLLRRQRKNNKVEAPAHIYDTVNNISGTKEDQRMSMEDNIVYGWSKTTTDNDGSKPTNRNENRAEHIQMEPNVVYGTNSDR